MKRRTFIELGGKSSLAIALLGATAACKSAKSTNSEIQLKLSSVAQGTLTTIRGGVSRFNMKGGTIGVLETDSGYAVIDAQFPDTVKFLLDSIMDTEKPINVLANTHHHADHTAGNFSFKDMNTKIIAQSEVPRYQKLRAEEKGSTDQQIYANILFDKNFKMEVGGHNINAHHYGAAHTFGDAIFHFERENVVHMGDLVFNNLLPVFRVADGSNAKNWASILGKIHSEYDEDTIFIFGHANQTEFTQGNKNDLQKMKIFMEDVQSFGEQQFVEKGKSVEEVANEYSHIPAYPNRMPIWEGHWQEFLQNLKDSVMG